MQKDIPTLEALQEEAGKFALSLSPKPEGATLVTLAGELGAGKTSFTQGMARALGVTEHVTSPTFVLEKTYDLTDQASTRLVHIDAYRLEGGKALAPLNFDELAKDAGNLIVLEWPEKVTDGLPFSDHALTLETLPDNTRSLTYGT